MFTPVQQHALDRFAKSLLTLADDSLIDAYHQAWEDHRDARPEDSDNLEAAKPRTIKIGTTVETVPPQVTEQKAA